MGAGVREDLSAVHSDGREAYINGQPNTKPAFFAAAGLPLRSSSRSAPTVSTVSSAPEIPPVPLSPTDGISKSGNSVSTPRTFQQCISNESYRTNLNSATYIQNLRQKPSESSKLRVKSKTSPTLQMEKTQIVEGGSYDDVLYPRLSGLSSSGESARPPLKTSSTFPLQSHEEAPARSAFPQAARDRGRSTSSSRSNFSFPSIPLRPSTSIPDYGTAESTFSRQRKLSNNSGYRPGKGVTETNGVINYRHEPKFGANAIDSEEIRASFRSALTSNSSYFATTATERSSVMTKSTSATSVYGQEEGMSVDDAIGMYENGFADSGEENECASRPDTAVSYRGSQIKGPNLGFEAQGLPPPSNFLVQDSTAMVQVPNRGFETVDGPARTPSVENGLNMSRRAVPRTLNGDNEARQIITQQSPTPSSDLRDRYGFYKKSQHVSFAQYDEWNGPYTDYLARRKIKWVTLLNDSGLPTDNPSSFPQRSSKVKRFIRKGIPPDWRGAAWFFYAGGHEIIAKHHGLYATLLKKSVDSENEELIERDLNRTFPDNVRFKPDPNVMPDPAQSDRNSLTHLETPMLQSLRRVLQSFSIYNPRIGYCQSLNYIAGLLLLFLDEEKSFWLLNIITHEYLPGTHEMNLEGVNVDLGVLMQSIRESMPFVWAKIGGELDGTSGASQVSPTMRLPPITLCCSAWFMSCFIGTLPIETTLRVWDSFFYEGSKTLFRIALAIFKVGEAEIRAVNDSMEIFQVVQTIPRRLIDASALIEACFKRRNGFGHLSQDTIDMRRAERRKGYAEERRRVATGAVVAMHRKPTMFSRRKEKGKRKDAL